MAYFHTTVLDNQIKALPTVDTASGSIATFDTDMTENLVEVICQIVAQQSGSGTPSPSNPRPITVYTSLNLSHSGADTSNPTVYNIPFGQSIANGVINVTTGKLRVTWIEVDLGSLRWFKGGSYNNLFYATPTIEAKRPLNDSTVGAIKAEIYETLAYNSINVNDNTTMGISLRSLDVVPTIRIKDPAYQSSSETDFENAMSGKLAIYELATPIEIQLDSVQIQALLNENNIWCDTGDTEVKFLLTVGKKIS